MYYFIVNRKSRTGKAKKIWEKVEAELKRRKVEYEAYLTEYAGHASVMADQICGEDDSVKKIVVFGGDGTVNEVVNGIEDYRNVILGYVPSGSSNDLARSMGIPRDSLEALDRVLNSKNLIYIDHGQIDFCDGNPTRRFAVSAGIGFDAAVCKEAMHSTVKEILNRLGLGKLTYVGIAVRQILSGAMFDAQITVNDNKKHTVRNVFFMTAMNQKYEGGGLPMAPQADPTDGLLSVCLVHGIPRWKILLMFPTIFAGKHVLVKGIDTFNCKSVELQASRQMGVHTDGEVGIQRSRVKMSIYPDKIRMMQ